MDSGIFLSSRKYLLSWILVPLAAAAIFYFFLYGYFKGREAVFREEKCFIESAPGLKRKILAAEKLLKNYDINLSKTGIIEKLNSQLKDMAQLAGLTIISMDIGANQQSAKKGSVLRAAIKADGTLSSVAAFLSAVRDSGMLLTVDFVGMRLSAAGSARDYSAEFILLYRSL